MPFPREQPISQQDLIMAAHADVFGDFDIELSNNTTYTHQDFDYTEVPVAGQPSHQGATFSFIVARQKGAASHWVFDPEQSEWHYLASIDHLGNLTDSSGALISGGAPAQVSALSQCAKCGANNPPGFKFCNSCGTQPVAPGGMTIPVVAGPGGLTLGTPTVGTGPGVIGVGSGLQPGCRMTEIPASKRPLVIPPGLGKSDEPDGFQKMLDQMIAAEEAAKST